MADDLSGLLSNQGAVATLANAANPASPPADYTAMASGLTPQLSGIQNQAQAGLAGIDKQRDQVMADIGAIPKPAAPKLQPLPIQQVQDQLQDKNSELSVFKLVGPILASLGSMKSRQPLTAALNSAAGMIQGYHQADVESARQHEQAWKDQVAAAMKQNQQEIDAYNSVLSNTKLTLDEKKAQLEALTAQHSDTLAIAELKQNGVLGMERIMEMRQSAQDKLDAARTAAQDKADAKKEKEDADNKAMQENAETIANYDAPPPSAYRLSTAEGAKQMDMVRKINPNYDATKYAEKQRAVVAFGSGKQGDTTRSLNVATNHLDQLDGLVDALGNGDTKTINRIANDIKTQFGLDAAPADFEAAKEIVGDEVMKAVIGSGGGVSDRQKAQDAIDRANSPKLLKGVIQAYKGLMAGQLGGLSQQYENTTGNKDFDSKLSPAAQKELGAKNASTAPPKVGDVVKGYRYKGGPPHDPSSWEAVQ